jgi:choline transport protein
MANTDETKGELYVEEMQDPDALEMARMGKKQALKRRFGFFSILGFACSIAITWTGVLVVFISGLENGGPAGPIYGYIFVWIGTLAIFTTMAELVSMMPTSGGQYHWAAMLSPKSCRKFVSYITGWLVMAGWEAVLAMIQGMVVLNYPDYGFKRWHGTLLYWAVVVLALLVNTIASRLLPKIESAILVLYLI